MSLRDYSDEDDFYSQGLEHDGFVSIWVGFKDDSEDPDGLDVLQDLCGVGYYDLSKQEGNCFDFKSVSVKLLLEEMSYSESFMKAALAAAEAKGLSEALWVTLQYDFEYDPSKVKRKIHDDPIFLGAFPYQK